MMTIMIANVAAITIAALFYAWRNFNQTAMLAKRAVQQERVAYMLWVAAEGSPSQTREIRILGRTG